ncbi:hypothetical protein [Arcticibacter svalbardensis]|uniref:hypothetical protein n=1 Tax=Arcticibacter svalbardensis TaxID=1288027 RepID=UPI00058DEB34|nr:hypothetical protein [Arcticibacter svalbardensis]
MKKYIRIKIFYNLKKNPIKKILKITGITAFAAALFFTVSLNGESNSNNMDLASLTKISEANAECVTGVSVGGTCSWTGRCFFSTDNECDPHNSN